MLVTYADLDTNYFLRPQAVLILISGSITSPTISATQIHKTRDQPWSKPADGDAPQLDSGNTVIERLCKEGETCRERIVPSCNITLQSWWGLIPSPAAAERETKRKKLS